MTRRNLTNQRNQCPGCNEYFNSNLAFDKHRTGRHGVDRRCRTPLEMTEHGMFVSSSGWWVSELRDPADFAQNDSDDTQETA